MKKQLQKGFTLIELMIVVAIIGILASIALPAYQDYIARSQMTEAVTIMSAQKATIAEIYADEGVLTNADNNKQGIPAKGDMKGKYLKEVTITNGVMVALMETAGVSKGIQGKKLTISPTAAANGIITWKCGKAGDAAAKYLPKACRY